MKKTRMIPLACILLFLIGAVIFAVGRGKRGDMPYKDLDAAEIISAMVHLTPPDKTVEIEDLQELAEYLNVVIIYKEDNSYAEYTGQGVTFTLTLAEGTQTRIMAYNPFLVIDGVGYRTEYEPCKALNSYANRLLNQENASVILEEPPTLMVVSDEVAEAALLGTYSWQKRNGDGTSTGIEADSAHPLECEALLDKMETSESRAVLRFGENPDAILSVRCWSEEHWGDPEAEGENVPLDGYEIELKPGGYIYEIQAEWDTGNGYGGRASYSFYIESMAAP